MQQKLPCDLCHRSFREKAIVAYHAWFSGENRVCYKQRMCLACWRPNYERTLKLSQDLEDNETPDPETCPACGEGTVADDDRTWTTWYRGQNRKDTVVSLCAHCAANTRQVMMVGAERQPDRELAGVRAGGAPLPNPAGFGSRDDLPW